jgi:EAL domain-containing protein (putative c-di-GMP-specific phosphodiesterase class I)/ActR/RegA family two-component response regulator
MPFRRNPENREAGQSGRASTVDQLNSLKRLLVVDDERVQRTLIVRAVAPMDYIVDAAGDLRQAAAHLKEHRYDAVVLDLSLGETEGISLLQAVRDNGSDPAIIFVSHLDERILTASTRLASSLGLRVAGMLQKPASPSALRALLRNAPRQTIQRTHAVEKPPDAVELAGAIRDHVIVPYFQPQISLRDQLVVGVEALARWPRDGGNVSPEVFVPLAEQSGLIGSLTSLIMRASLEACGRWRVRHPNCRVAVNISPLVLASPGLPDEIEHLLAETGLGPGALIAEITESSVIAQPVLAAEVLTRLRIKGIELSIDDFGTGHSSLLALLRLPYSELKIDRSFISLCDTDPEAWKIVRAIISMARELGMRVVAEGIETGSIVSLLKRVGCEVGQGWYFAQAMPETQLAHWLSAGAVVPA